MTIKVLDTFPSKVGNTRTDEISCMYVTSSGFMRHEYICIEMFLNFKLMKQSYVYILKCSDNSYYTGITSNLIKRLTEHKYGKHPESYTYNRRPLELVFYAEFTDINLAIQTEKQIKKWSRAKKEALISGAFDKLPNLAKKKFN